MIWLLLRLHRTTLLLATAATALAGAALVAYRLLSTNALVAGGLAQSCIADHTLDCRKVALTFLSSPAGEGAAQLLGTFSGFGYLVMVAVPLVLGLLTGAGVIGRELGRDAHLLTLTQNLGRARWWASRLALAAGVAVVGSVLVGAVGSWAYAPLEGLLAPPRPLQTPIFETSGLVPAGQALLACALGAVLGLLTRNAAVAAFATTVAYVVILFVLASPGVRGAYLPPVTVTADAYTDEVLSGAQLGESDWTLGQRYLDAAGDPVPQSAVYSDDRCDGLDCLRNAGVVAVQYEVQPASRYWLFQAIETGILLVLAAGAVAVGSLRLRRSLVR